jgi:hypothetical protein
VEKALNFYAVTKTKRAPAVPVYDRRHKLCGFTTQRALDKVRKAKGDPQVAVFDVAGNLVGTIDPGDLNPLATVTPPQSAAGSTDTDRGTGLTTGDPEAQAVAKAQRRRIMSSFLRTAAPSRVAGRRGR